MRSRPFAALATAVGMSRVLSFAPRHALELGCVTLVVSVAVLLAASGEWGAVPVNLAWIGITLLCCCPWARGRFAVIVSFGVLATAAVVALSWTIGSLETDLEETAELAVAAAVGLLVIHYARQRDEALGELRRSAQRERELVLERAHRLRTDLAIALGHAELMRHDSGPVASGAGRSNEGGDLDTVIDGLRRLRLGVNRLMGAEEAAHEERGEVDLDRVVTGLARRWVGTARRRWTISNHASGTIAGDEEELTLALDCLIENAVQATTEGDSVSLTTRNEGEEIFIEATDSGCGIPLDAQPRIFEPFLRANDRAGGLGLGLAITKAVVENHGGTVEVDSEVGRGTTFTIRLARRSRMADEADLFETPFDTPPRTPLPRLQSV